MLLSSLGLEAHARENDHEQDVNDSSSPENIRGYISTCHVRIITVDGTWNVGLVQPLTSAGGLMNQSGGESYISTAPGGVLYVEQ